MAQTGKFFDYTPSLILGGVFFAVLLAGAPLQGNRDGGPLHKMVEYKSVNGVLAVTLEGGRQKVHVGDVSFDGGVFNGEYAGPVLMAHPCDTLRIKFINHLARTANIHYHGLETSPLGNSDNIHVAVKPGESFDYEVKIAKTQAPGTYWLHDHTHGVSEMNVMGGLSATLMVEGFAEQFPELAGVKEQIMVLKDYQFYDSTDPHIIKDLHRVVQSVNGQTFAKIEMHPGETQLWHLTNQSADRIIHMSLAGHKFRVIGDDARAALSEKITDVLDIKPGSRLEVLVDAGAAGTYGLETRAPTGDGAKFSLSRPLGQIVVSGVPMKTAPAIKSFPHNEDLRTRKIDKHRTLVFSQQGDGKTFLMNGRRFDANRIDLRVPLGNTEEWTLRNDTDDFHVFHIHQVHYQVTELNGKALPFNGYVDNVELPMRGTVKVIIPFNDPIIVGKFVVHCHVLQHEDNGMMMHMEVYDPNNDSGHPFFAATRDMCGSKPGKTSISGEGKACYNPAVGGGFKLTNQNGKQVSGNDFGGRYKLIFFGFTACTDLCPTTVLAMSQVMEQLKGDAKKLAPIFVTIDPETDTPKQLKSFLKHFSPAITGLTGTKKQIEAVEAEYQVYAPKVDGKTQPIGDDSDHSGYMYLMDPEGNYLTVFTADSSPAAIAGKIKAYMQAK